MIASRVTPSHEDAWLTLYREGMTVRAIAEDTGFPVASVHGGLQRARQRGGTSSTGETKPRRLVVIYGSSNKALKLLKCIDVHPCPTCRGMPLSIDWDEILICPDCPGLSCPLCRGEGMVKLPQRVDVDCETCQGTGVGPIPKGSRCCCGAEGCNMSSGLDHLPGYFVTAKEKLDYEADHKRAMMARRTLTRLKRVKGGRK